MKTTVESALAKHSLFGRLTDDERARIAVMGKPVDHDAGSFLFRQNEPSNGMHLLVSGTVRLSRTNRSAGAFVLAELHEGDVLGDLELLDRGPRLVTATAAEPCTTIFFPYEGFNELVEDRDPVAQELVTLLSRHASGRLREMNRAIVDAFNEPGAVGKVNLSRLQRPDREFFHGLIAGLLEPARQG